MRTDGSSHASQKLLADGCNCTTRTVTAAIGRIERHGYLNVCRHGGCPC